MEIKISRAGEEPKTKEFTGPLIKIGRNPDNDVVLDSKACSRYHAEVVREKGDYKIKDLGSANGIVIDGKQVSELPVTDGLVVELGDYTVTFTLEDATDKTMLFGKRAEPETEGTVMLSRPAKAPAAPVAAAPPVAPAPVVAPPTRELFLHYTAGKSARHLRVVSGAEYVIGRAPDADVVLDDGQASLRHARIYSRGQDFFVADMGSSNGTAVNRDRIEGERQIDVDDVIQVGRSTIEVSGDKPDADDAAIMAQTRIGMSPFAAKKPGAPAPAPHAAAAPAPTASAAEPRRPAAAAPQAAHAEATAGEPEEPAAKPVWMSLPVLLGGGGVLVTIVLVGGFFLVRKVIAPAPSASPSASAVVRVQVAPVVSKDLLFQITATGSIKPKESATVSSEVPARILDVPIREGQTVMKGALLARLNDRDLQLQITEAQSAITKEQVDLAKEQYERHQRLVAQGALTKTILDQSKTQYLTLNSAYQSAQAKIRQLREQMTKTQILSPISGVVAKKFVSPGELLAPGAPVAIVENTEEVLVDVEISDRDVVKIHPSMEVETTTDAFPGRTFKGVIDKVGSTANPVTRSFNVQARITNHEQELRSGMIASLRVVLARKRALAAPIEAIAGEGEAAKVFVVKNGVAKRLAVKLGDKVDREVEVISGLAEGDEVVVYGGESLSDGQACQGYRK